MTDTAAPPPDIAARFDTGGWAFTEEVVHVAEVADWLLPTGGTFADLGASTGETLGALLDRHPTREFTAHLYDEQSAMLDRAKATLNPRAGGRIHYHQQRIQEPLEHEGADLTVALFTLQFLPLADRVRALDLARQAAAPTGALIVAEKIRPADPRWAEIANDRSHDWKAEHGIPDDAIRAKARALRGVLIPHPEDTLRAAITSAGWSHVEPLFCWHSWLVLGAFAT